MTAKSKEDTPPTGLALLRAPFPANQISKLPKPTAAQTEAVKRDFKAGIRCQICNGWHHPKVVHLDYVGHAALTDRLLDCDPAWNWEPIARMEDGTPKFDGFGGLWINLTVCGVTRLGYGHPDGKTGGDAVKEVIGDALRNAAMRFGAALDLWHKGELHVDEGARDDPAPAFDPVAAADRIITKLNKAKTLDALKEAFASEQQAIAEVKDADTAAYDRIAKAKDDRKAAMTPPDPASQAPDLGGDSIPY